MKCANLPFVLRNLFIFLLIQFLATDTFAQLDEDISYCTIKMSGSKSNELVDIIRGNANRNGDRVIVDYPKNSRTSQVWKFKKLRNGLYHITSVSTGRALDAKAQCMNNDGCTAQVWNYNGGRTQTWKVTREVNTRNGYRIELATNRKQLAVNYSPPLSTNLYLTSSRSKGQVFIIEKSRRIIKSNLFVDLRNYQTPYKNQTQPAGERGGCTYFSSIAAMEAAYKRAGYGNLDLSEEYMAIMTKTQYLHPDWSDITSANYRENQYAGGQGGGSLTWLTKIKIPVESIVPYGSHVLFPNRGNKNQTTCNNNFFEVLDKYSGINNARYYGISGFRSINRGDINEASLQRVLRTGKEVKVCITRGSHCYLLVGYDNTDPRDKRFIVKNSYQPHGTAAYDKTELPTLAQMTPITSAEYVTGITRPGKWTQKNILGRWKLNHDGWKGTLDIYHVPGIAQHWLGRTPDRRVGTYTDHKGKVHRVNGSLTRVGSNYKLTFYFNGRKTNLRWDELSGRKFELILNSRMDFMAGSYKDPSGKVYGAYATKNSYLSAPRFNITNIEGLQRKSFKMTVNQVQGTLRFGTVRRGKAKYIIGDFVNASGRIIKQYTFFENRGLKNGFYISEGRTLVHSPNNTGVVRFHSWEKGIMPGSIRKSGFTFPVCLAYQR